MHRLHLITLAAATAALAAGCGSDPKPEPNVATAATTSTDANKTAPAETAHQDTATPTSGSLHIDDKILKACGDIPAAHFAFDSAKVDGAAAGALDALARCFTTGPLAGRNMLLTGHADPRGEVEYNMGLGQRRSGSVAAYLEGHGMAKAHLSSTSRGAMDATGTDEQGWARDRKVVVTLVE